MKAALLTDETRATGRSTTETEQRLPGLGARLVGLVPVNAFQVGAAGALAVYMAKIALACTTLPPVVLCPLATLVGRAPVRHLAREAAPAQAIHSARDRRWHRCRRWSHRGGAHWGCRRS